MDKLKKELWYDCRGLSEEESARVLPLVFNLGYDGIMIQPDQRDLVEKAPSGCATLVFLQADETKAYGDMREWAEKRRVVVISPDHAVLERYREFQRGMAIRVDDAASLSTAVDLTGCYDYIVVEFKDETNIPLELLLAFSQKNKGRVCKRIARSDEGWIAGMVMEMGSHALLLASRDSGEIINLRKRTDSMQSDELDLKTMTVVEIRHIGMGDRVCVDTASYLAPDEGMIVGSTSRGGLLMSSETHFLPYMELRPFRVNAGALHSYAWCPDGQTRYLSELEAGDPVMTVNTSGKTRTVAVGRVKMERRPLLMIRAVSESGVEVNAITQDDWHVRLLGPGGQARNCTRLTAAETVLGYVCRPGRHVGIPIDEMILEK